MRTRRLTMIALAFSAAFPVSAMAIQAPGGSSGSSVKVQRIEAVRADPRVGDELAPCPSEVLEDIIAKYEARRSHELITTAEYQARPTKSDSLDCFSSLLNASFGFNIPSLGDVAASVFKQLKESACRLAVNKSNQLLNTAGLNFNQDLGTEFYIPGTNERIDVDAGNVNTGVGSRTSANTRGGGTSGVSGNVSGGATQGGGVSGGGSVSSGTSSGDLDGFLRGIF